MRLPTGTKIWYTVNDLKKRPGIILGWYYDSYYLVKSEKGDVQIVYPEYIFKLIKIKENEQISNC